jgi:photosystem II stability/assembly factor-like uncharacterized protein
LRFRLPTQLALAGLAFCLPGAQAYAQEEEDDHARRRWEWFFQQRAFPFGAIPAGALDRARTQLAALRLSFSAARVPPIAGTRWQAIGPRAIPTSGTSIGRISTVAVHPTNANLLYVGGAQGGVWRTTDGGISWTPLTDKECSLAMGSIALDPVNPAIVYAATGEQHFSGDSYYGCGVLRSTDGGNTWTRLGATTFIRSRISRLLILPSTAGTVTTTTILVAADNGLWRSANGGASWTQLRTGIATDLVLDPANEQIMYVAVRTQGVFRSADGGTTWQPLGVGFPTASVGRINIAITRTASNRLFASVHNISDSMLLGIWTTTDAGATWTQLPATGASCGNQCWYDMFIAVHPTNPNTIYFGGVRLYRSLDGGVSFATIGNSIHVDQHNIAFDPQNPQRVYVTNDGGIYRSDDGGTSWVSLSAGLELTQFYGGISLHPSEHAIVLGGTQDNGTLRYNNNPTWAAVIGGDGGFTAINYDNPTIQFGETQWTTTSMSSGPRRSDAGGPFARKVNGIVTTETALFIPPMVMDPNNPQVLYFGTNRLYRTTDAAESWRPISAALTPSGAISAIAPAAPDPATVYVGTSTGLLHVTRDTGATWTQRNTGLPQRSITDVAVDRADPLTAYVSVSGFGTGHVFRTVNGGQSWSNVSSNLPDIPVNALLLDPVSRGIVMIGSDLGVFMSADSGASWTVVDDGMPNVAVFDLAYNTATASLVAATHGRGMFQLQLNRPLTLAVVPKRRKATMVEGTPTVSRDSATVVLTGTGSGIASWTASHLGGSWNTFTTTTGTSGGRVSWTRSVTGLAPGTYVDTITIASTGALDSPARLVDTLVVESSIPVLNVTPGVRRDTVPAGSTALRADSATISLLGFTGPQTAWTAQARKGNWITLTRAAGTGSGRVLWNRNPAGLNLGTYVDTITITAGSATGSPWSLVDSLIIVPTLAVSAASRSDTLQSGSSATSSVTRQLTIGGDPDGTVDWTVTHSGNWNTLLTTSGRGNGSLAWTRSAADLRDGVFVDTITVRAGGARLAVLDTLVVSAPAVANQCAVNHLFGTSCLDAAQLRWLDLAGNRDGQYNLGDLLAFLSRSGGSPAALRTRKR